MKRQFSARRLALLALSAWMAGGWPVHGVAAEAVDPAAAFQAIVETAAEEEAYAMGLEAYLYGYPRVELARRIHNETRRVSDGQIIYAPLNRFYYFDRLARPGDGLVIKAPNNDTLYASAYLDLSKEPVVLRVPEVGQRYYVALIVDASGDVGTRLSRTVSGAGGEDLVFVGPGYNGPLPAGAKVSRQRANDLWLLMRVTSGGGADEVEAASLLKRFTLSELSRVEQRPATGSNAAVALEPVQAALAPIDNLAFFVVLDRMLTRNPVPAEDRGMLLRWQRIGLAGVGFDETRLAPAVRKGLLRAIASGQKIVAAAQFGIANNVNGWNYSDKIGRIRNDWALNAAIARGGYGNVAEDSVYHQRSLDAKGAQLTGAMGYTMTFPADQLPPVGAFWSVTAYDQNQFDLIENPIRRYSFSDRTPGLRRNPDGSLTIAIRARPPAEPLLRANWLPVGTGPFYLIMRTYDPAPQIATGEWAPPPVLVAP